MRRTVVLMSALLMLAATVRAQATHTYTAVVDGTSIEIVLTPGKVQKVGDYATQTFQTITYGEQKYTLVGVSTAVNYEIRPIAGKLPKRLVAREEVSLVRQSHPGYDLADVKRVIEVPVQGRSGSAFSDIWQWPAYQVIEKTKALWFPPDFNFTARQVLTLNGVRFAEIDITFWPAKGQISFVSKATSENQQVSRNQ